MRINLKKKTSERLSSRLIKKTRIRKKLGGTAERPRLCVFRSAKHMYAQLVNDVDNKTLLAVSSLSLKSDQSGKDLAFEVGKAIAKVAIEKQIKNVVFDRNGFIYHGRVKALADGAREAGLLF